MALQVIIASAIFSLTITKKRCKHQPHAVKVWRMATQSQFLLTECIHTIKKKKILVIWDFKRWERRAMSECWFYVNFFHSLSLLFARPINMDFCFGRTVFVFSFFSCNVKFLFYFPVIFSLLMETGHSNRCSCLTNMTSVQLLASFIISSIILNG